MNCVHGRDVSFGFECWECEQEKRRHRESIELQQQALEDQREALEQQRRHNEEVRLARERQEDLLREAAYAQEQVAQAQHAQLALQRAQAEEAKARLEAEEQRRELRTGLPEFSEEYRNAWLSVSSANDALETKTAALNEQLRQAIASEESTHREVTKTWDQIHKDLAEELQAKLAQGTPNLIDPPPELADEKARLELDHNATTIKAIRNKLGSTVTNTLPTDGPVLRLYRELAAFAERIDALSKSPPKTPGGAIGCLAFLIACALVALANVFQQPAKYGVAFLFYVAVAAIPAVIAARRYSLIQAISASLSPIHEAATAIVALLTKIPDVEASRPLAASVSSSQASRADRIRFIANATAAALHANVLALLEMYKSANFKSHSRAPSLAALNDEWRLKTERVARVRESLARSPDEELTVHSHESMRAEIRRVGRQILDGRRVPGQRIELRRCSHCGAVLNSEMQGCPRCGAHS